MNGSGCSSGCRSKWRCASGLRELASFPFRVPFSSPPLSPPHPPLPPPQLQITGICHEWNPLMSVPTSTPRGSAPISSQSPITASVVKFRCLYTHDVRRKSKRWQDGYLRYHAFNKRVMVYDDSGNYIGDHHWRSTDEVQDGDELELDKGVLIEVGERMGTTQQDLTNLFEKRKSSQTSPPSNHSQTRPTPTPTHAPAPTPTPISTSTSARPSGSQTFRSLNDLLGIKRTPIGYRPSPYEERHPQPPTPSLPDSSERAPKRPRVSAGTTPARSRNVQSEVVDLTEPKPRQPTRPPSLSAPREKAKPLKDARPNLPVPVEEPQPRSQPRPRSRPKEAPPMPKPSRQEPPKQDPPTFTRPPIHPPPETTNQPAPIPVSPVEPPVESRAAPSNPPNSYEPPHNDVPRNPRTSRPNPNTEPPAQPVKTLRMSTEKPRRKLMYSALLPSDTSQKSSPSSAMGPPAKRSQPTPKPKESQSVCAHII